MTAGDAAAVHCEGPAVNRHARSVAADDGAAVHRERRRRLILADANNGHVPFGAARNDAFAGLVKEIQGNVFLESDDRNDIIHVRARDRLAVQAQVGRALRDLPHSVERHVLRQIVAARKARKAVCGSHACAVLLRRQRVRPRGEGDLVVGVGCGFGLKAAEIDDVAIIIMVLKSCNGNRFASPIICIIVIKLFGRIVIPPHKFDQVQLTFDHKKDVNICISTNAVNDVGPVRDDPRLRLFEGAFADVLLDDLAYIGDLAEGDGVAFDFRLIELGGIELEEFVAASGCRYIENELKVCVLPNLSFARFDGNRAACRKIKAFRFDDGIRIKGRVACNDQFAAVDRDILYRTESHFHLCDGCFHLILGVDRTVHVRKVLAADAPRILGRVAHDHPGDVALRDLTFLGIPVAAAGDGAVQGIEQRVVRRRQADSRRKRQQKRQREQNAQQSFHSLVHEIPPLFFALRR